MYKYYKQLANAYQANSISKDKIKEKIKSNQEMINELSSDDNEGYIDTLAIDRLNYELKVLQELL